MNDTSRRRLQWSRYARGAGFALAFTFVLSWPGCYEPVYIGGECAEYADCHSPWQDIVGSSCVEGRCVCHGSDEDWCCPGGGFDTCKSYDDLRCRHREECHRSAGDEGGAGGSSGAGSSGGVGSVGGVGGAAGGGAVECVAPSSCPQPGDGRCGKATCAGGVCGLTVEPFGKRASQFRGDCAQVYCDGFGNSVVIEDGGDVYNDGKQCTMDVCVGGKPVGEPFPDGTTCPEGGSGVCFQGECVQCIQDLADQYCPDGYACDQALCVPEMCKSPKPLCGQTVCVPCVAGQSCSQDSDCIDGLCGPMGTCSLATCSDGLRNDGETGVDCGSPSCGPCPDGEGCAKPSDCQSGVCWTAKCQPPKCDDGVKNGDETDTDCGGPCDACP